ncbi:hypothetical protein [Winogradskyella bathintestinalis]|uniref:Uncharacterized protein n=1 Tax=Winogradskyella bathintestinalis TaxID=3035208 RepID=A0ABT7ZXF9_9FLAO|nr:hypothetical protein [Winogradskyella bathintestinalis]MDN3493698.1 hypothetical protein [Winogradskyella bathintestinalis]
MKTTLFIITFLFTFHLSAQDPILQNRDKALEAVATKITTTYDDQLGLDGKQFTLFEKKVEEYLIREEKIHEEFNGEDKLSKLYKLRKAETMEMRNILTQPQFDLYKRIKSQLQPLAVIDSDGNDYKEN